MVMLTIWSVGGPAAVLDLGSVAYGNMNRKGYVDIQYTYVIIDDMDTHTNVLGSGYVWSRFDLGITDKQRLVRGKAYTSSSAALGWSCELRPYKCSVPASTMGSVGSAACRSALSRAIGTHTLAIHDGSGQADQGTRVLGLRQTMERAFLDSKFGEDTFVFVGGSRGGGGDPTIAWATIGKQTGWAELQHKAVSLGPLEGSPLDKGIICFESVGPSQR
ncbi:hypothetical protein DSO52_25175 [Salmonella enterica]|nr:hypothetical protein [Salmonella enterica]